MKKDTSKSTLLVIIIGFIVVYLLLNQKWAIYTALIVGLIGLISSWGASKIEWIWFKLSDFLSKIMPTILLAAIFYCILFPISLISKLFTKDPLLLKNNYHSTFTDVAKTEIKINMEKTW